MGAFLKQMPKSEGGYQMHKSTGNRDVSVPTLKEIGITNNESSRAQKLADIPANEFADRIAVLYDTESF